MGYINAMRILLLLILLSLTLSPIAGSASAAAPEMMAMEHQQMSDHDCCDEEPVATELVNSSSHNACEGDCGDCQQQCHSTSSVALTMLQLKHNHSHAERFSFYSDLSSIDPEQQNKPPMPA